MVKTAHISEHEFLRGSHVLVDLLISKCGDMWQRDAWLCTWLREQNVHSWFTSFDYNVILPSASHKCWLFYFICFASCIFSLVFSGLEIMKSFHWKASSAWVLRRGQKQGTSEGNQSHLRRPDYLFKIYVLRDLWWF